MMSELPQHRPGRLTRRGRIKRNISNTRQTTKIKHEALFIRSPAGLVKPLQYTDSQVSLPSSPPRQMQAPRFLRSRGAGHTRRLSFRPVVVCKSVNGNSIGQSSVQLQSPYALPALKHQPALPGPMSGQGDPSIHTVFANPNPRYFEVVDAIPGNQIFAPYENQLMHTAVHSRYDTFSVPDFPFHPYQSQYLPQVYEGDINIHTVQIQSGYYPHINPDNFPGQHWGQQFNSDPFNQSKDMGRTWSTPATCYMGGDQINTSQVPYRYYQENRVWRGDTSRTDTQTRSEERHLPLHQTLSDPDQTVQTDKVCNQISEPDLAEMISTALLTTTLGHSAFFDNKSDFDDALRSLREELVDIISSTRQTNALKKTNGDTPYPCEPNVSIRAFQGYFPGINSVGFHGVRFPYPGMSIVEMGSVTNLNSCISQTEMLRAANMYMPNVGVKDPKVNSSGLFKVDEEDIATEEEEASETDESDIESSRSHPAACRPIVWLGVDSNIDSKDTNSMHTDQCEGNVNSNASCSDPLSSI